MKDPLSAAVGTLVVKRAEGDMTEVSAATTDLDIVLMIMDRSTSSTKLVRSDGKEATFPLEDNPFDADSRLERLTYSFRANLVYLETVRGEDILAELPSVDDPAPRRNRPVVYLDQKDWSTLAKVLYEPTKVPGAERDASEQLIAWARERKVILPMSGGHMSETCKWTDDEARYRLALTILQLSSGWQMRDPLDVRRFELRRSFTSRFRSIDLPDREVFTLEPYAVNRLSPDGRRLEIPVEFPADVALATAALTSISGNFDTMLDAKYVPMGSSPGWVIKNQKFTDWLMIETARTSPQKRKSVDVLFLDDTSKEIAEEAFRAGITPEQMSTWTMSHRDVEVPVMPSLGLFRETFIGMHLNGARWENNHLTDLMYLTCAAGYADYVVAERSLAGYMQQALKRMKRPASVYRQIQDLVPVLEGRLSA
ncbi:hypothetical protein BH09ACT5_BH09ACT5_05970 [soil metagenome]